MTQLLIISGGQTGVDRAALDAALGAGVRCRGWCPKGRRAEDGRIADRYPLQETKSRGYGQRTRANVRDSQATLIVVEKATAPLSGGTALTADVARRLGRPLLIVGAGDPAEQETDLAEILAWIATNNITVLNIAGPRESSSPGIYQAARRLLDGVMQAFERNT